MNIKKQRKEDFISELEALLKKHNATMEASRTYYGEHSCVIDVTMMGGIEFEIIKIGEHYE